MKARLGGTVDGLKLVSAGREIQIVIERRGPASAPMWLLLPALSTVSSRSEWKAFAESIGEQCQLVSFDWPGFGDSDRPPIRYDATLLRQALQAVLNHLKHDRQEPITLVAAGHSASIALGLASDCSKQWKQLVLVAPTWRGPLPTMTRWHPKHFGWVRQLVRTPLIGPLLYRLNTSRAILKLMLRRHVWVDRNLLTPTRVREQQRLSRQRGSRFASVSFVSGGLDPAGDRNWWLEQAKQLHCPWHVVLAMEAPPRSSHEMELLAEHADKVSRINGRLGLHQEFGADLSEQLLSA